MKSNNKLRLILVYAAYIIVLGVLQFRWPDSRSAWGIKPDFLLVLTIFSGYLFGFTDGAVVGLICGFFRDCLGARIFGSGMLMLFLAGVLASVLFQKNMNRTVLTVFLSVITITLLTDVVIFIIQYALLRATGVQMWPLSVPAYLGKRVLPLELMNLLFALIFLPIFKNFGPYPRTIQKDRLSRDVRGEGML